MLVCWVSVLAIFRLADLPASSPSSIRTMRGGGWQELELSAGDLDTEQCDGGEAYLHQAHDAPGAFHHHESLVPLSGDVVVTVEDLAFRQAEWEFPFAVTVRLLGIESPSGIAEGVCLWIVEADRDTPLQKSGTLVSARLEAMRRFRTDPFLL